MRNSSPGGRYRTMYLHESLMNGARLGTNGLPYFANFRKQHDHQFRIEIYTTQPVPCLHRPVARQLWLRVDTAGGTTLSCGNWLSPRGTKAYTKDHPSTAMKLIHVVGQGAGAQNISQSQRRSPLTPGGDWNLRVNLDQQLNLPLLPTDDPATTPLAPSETPCS